jgi:hypothetical protein
MAKVVCVLYEEPIEGYPPAYARDDLPRIDRYPDGQTLPTPKAVDFQPGAPLGSVGYVPLAMGHSGTGPLRFLEMFKSSYYADVALDQWMALIPPETIEATLNLSR